MHVNPVLIAGAGPAGLTAALELSRAGVPVAVHEAESAVGGIARTETYRGYRFDIGGHRFYTKVAEVERLWHELLGHELIRVPRLSRIYYRGRYYAYPLQLPNVVRNLGLVESARMTSSYLRARLQPADPEETLEDWVINRFGAAPVPDVLQDVHREGVGPALQRHPRRLGRAAHPGPLVQPRRLARDLPRRADDVARRRVPVPAARARADVGARRRGHHGGRRHREAAQPRRRPSPRRRAASPRRRWSPAGERQTIAVSDVISSMPLPALARTLAPAVDAETLEAAARLRFRDFLIVVLIVNRRGAVPRQLDLHPLAGREGRPHPELQELERGDGARPVDHEPGHGVLLLGRRRRVGT